MTSMLTISKFVEAIRRLIEEGIRKGEFRKGNPEEMAWAIIGAINVAMEVHLGRTRNGSWGAKDLPGS